MKLKLSKAIKSGDLATLKNNKIIRCGKNQTPIGIYLMWKNKEIAKLPKGEILIIRSTTLHSHGLLFKRISRI